MRKTDSIKKINSNEKKINEALADIYYIQEDMSNKSQIGHRHDVSQIDNIKIPVDGREIELTKDSTYIKWRYVGESTYKNLIAISELMQKGDKGDKGDDGQTPNITIGSVTTTTDGIATASISGQTPNLVLNLGIPKGKDGTSVSGGGSSSNLIPNITTTPLENEIFVAESASAGYEIVSVDKITFTGKNFKQDGAGGEFKIRCTKAGEIRVVFNTIGGRYYLYTTVINGKTENSTWLSNPEPIIVNLNVDDTLNVLFDTTGKGWSGTVTGDSPKTLAWNASSGKIEIATEVASYSENILVYKDIEEGKLKLTTDKYQTSTIADGTLIILPEVIRYTQIKLYIEGVSCSFILPNCKWKTPPCIEEGKSYEIIFTYTTEWVGEIVTYG